MDFIYEENIILDANANNKSEILHEMISVLDENGFLNNKERFTQDIWERENQISTEIGYGIAIPHAKSKEVKKPAIVVGRSLKGMQYDSERCKLFFLIAVNENASKEHLEILSKLSTYLMNDQFRANLILADSTQEVIQAFDNMEDLDENSDNGNAVYHDKKIVAVTGCQTGIAHTFMAAESLQKQAEEFGVSAKIQTNGSSGVGNELTAQDIAEADGIIIASDIKVDMEKFEGKRIIQGSSKDAIHHASQLINNALEGKGDIVGSQENKTIDDDKEKTRFKQPKVYQHLMNGVSFMIPFVVAGGILIAISFMFGINAADPESEQYNQFAAFLSTVGGEAAFQLMVPILAGYIAYSIADRPGLAPGMIGGFLATIGGSGFLGGMIAGFLAGYVILGLKKLLNNLPSTLQGLNPVLLFPLLGTFVVGFIMYFLVNTPLSWVNEGLQGWLQGLTGANAILLGGLLGAMMASDMGGPINKTASAFGLAMFASGVYGPTAALMVGGMVPPLGIAIATTMFKNKFDSEERNAGKAAYVLGASFITEAAIPFAAKDPLRIIPANIIGGAIGGAMCMGVGITLQAPHGGIFVIPIAASSPFLYILCILVGSIITAGIVGYLKKPIYEIENQPENKKSKLKTDENNSGSFEKTS